MLGRFCTSNEVQRLTNGRAEAACKMHDMRFGFIRWTMTAGVVGFVLLAGVVRAQQTSAVDAALQQELAALSEKHHGKVALYASQLNTGKTVALDADRPVQTASVIKLTILLEAMEQVQIGRAHV